MYCIIPYKVPVDVSSIRGKSKKIKAKVKKAKTRYEEELGSLLGAGMTETSVT